MKYIVIGAGISGLSIAQLLKDRNEVVVFEKDSRPGGMIKCDRVNGSLFHRTGGHVFNTKRQDVLKWFWRYFNKKIEFTKALRNSVIHLSDDNVIPYPIEDHVYLLNESIVKAVIEDMLSIAKRRDYIPENFEEFLAGKFGKTLYQIYFEPYNYKVWRRDLSKIPLSWLDGKLPMPTVQEIMYNNIHRIEERSFVHSSFFYPKNNGSQFLADRLAENLDIIYNTTVEKIEKKTDGWYVNGIKCDRIVFCGNIKQLPSLVGDHIDFSFFEQQIEKLEFHGTTSVFCEVEQNPFSWIYLPNKMYEAHRIICTGNFADSNRTCNKMTATIEFTDYISKEDIMDNLKKVPYSPHYLTHHYEKFTYPIQQVSTRNMITSLKAILETQGMYLLGRFAEWEYYNMDAAMGAALDLNKRINK